MASERTERSIAREYLEALIIAAVFLQFANTFVLQTFYIPSGSMEETLLIGDHLFVNRFIYGPTGGGWGKALFPFREVERGDIVVFRSPQDPKLDIVKRCVGVAGDTIRMRNKQLYINDEAVDDASYTIHSDETVFPNRPYIPSAQMRIRDNFGPVAVPANHYFCLGDNRDNSHDSRFWGPLPAHLVKGRAVMIYWSYDSADGRLLGGAERGSKLAALGKKALGFFGNTRWERTFQVIR
jgi:signal peptidase I